MDIQNLRKRLQDQETSINQQELDTSAYRNFRQNLLIPISYTIGASEMLLETPDKLTTEERVREVQIIRLLALQIREQISHHLHPNRMWETFEAIATFLTSLEAPIRQLSVKVQLLLDEVQRAGEDELTHQMQILEKAAQELALACENAPRPLVRDFFMLEQVEKETDNWFQCEKTFAPPLKQGKLLFICSDRPFAEVFIQRLELRGYEMSHVLTGEQALQFLLEHKVDGLLLDSELSDVNIIQFLGYLRETFTNIPIIVFSPVDDEETLVHYVRVGAEDCLPRAFDPVILKARLGACLEKKRLRDRELQILQALRQSEAALQEELNDAASYVESLLPPAIQKPFHTASTFLPSARLGGDSFGCHPIGTDHWAFYLLDVSGHGVGAALLSISILHTLEEHSLLNADFTRPNEVLAALNKTFRAENEDGKYFTIWYGVYHVPSSILTYASGGHPPALLLGREKAELLKTKGSCIGLMEEVTFEEKTFSIAPGDRLVLFSDGVYEFNLPKEERMLTLEEFISLAHETKADSPQNWTKIFLENLRTLHGNFNFEDDYSIFTAWFGPKALSTEGS